MNKNSKKPKHSEYDNICKYLKDYRRYLVSTKGDVYSQKSVAQDIEIGAQFLSNIERGLHLPPVYVVARLFEHYKIDAKIAFEMMLKEREKELRSLFKKAK